MNNFDYIVSLGHSCIPSLYAFTKNKLIPNTFFDHMWTSAWAIEQLLRNDFDGFFDKNEYEYLRPVDGSDMKFPTNKKYSIKFYPEDPIKNFDSFSESALIKKNAFINDILNSNKRILFLRHEEPIINPSQKLPGKAIIPEHCKCYYENNEIYYMTSLSNYLQTTYPNLQFYIMLVGNHTTPPMELSYTPSAKLFTIPNENIDYANYVGVFDKIFNDNDTFINTSLSLQ